MRREKVKGSEGCCNFAETANNATWQSQKATQCLQTSWKSRPILACNLFLYMLKAVTTISTWHSKFSLASTSTSEEFQNRFGNHTQNLSSSHDALLVYTTLTMLGVELRSSSKLEWEGKRESGEEVKCRTRISKVYTYCHLAGPRNMNYTNRKFRAPNQRGEKKRT